MERRSRIKHTPRRPEGGYSLLVTPLGSDAGEPYVATPDGTKRELSEAEEALIRRRTPMPRRKPV